MNKDFSKFLQNSKHASNYISKLFFSGFSLAKDLKTNILLQNYY